MSEGKIAIAWADLSYKVKQFIWSEEKIILNKLYGSIEFGSATALMGPSGAGKTSLLNCLNGKLNTCLDEKTKIYTNIDQKIRSSFVGQHEKEHLIMDLTSEENLMYASKLKNSNMTSKREIFDHKLNVKNIMNELLISDICDTRVEYCSGGQQKRLAIALEMVTIVKPNLLCIDEPTTGLDSNIAEIVMKCLSNMSKKYNIAVITSIHQPNHEIVMMFDKIYVLAKGGNCLFNGHPSAISSFLIKHEIHLGQDELPIEVLLKVSSNEANNYLEEMCVKTRHEIRREVLVDCADQTRLTPNGIERQSKSFKFVDIWHLLQRSMTRLYIRQWKPRAFIFFFYICFALSTSAMYNKDIGKPTGCFNPNNFNDSIDGHVTCLKEFENDDKLLQNQNFLFFISCMVSVIQLSISTLSAFTEFNLFFNEQQNSWYSTGSYFWAYLITETLPTLINSTTFGFFAYYGSGQIWERERLFGNILIMNLAFLCAQGIGNCVGTIMGKSRTFQIPILVAFFISIIINTFANFFVAVAELPIAVQYFSEMSFSKFVFNSALILIYGLNRCSTHERSIILLKYNLVDQSFLSNIYKLVAFFVITLIVMFISLYMQTDIRVNLKFKKNQGQKSEDLIELQDYINKDVVITQSTSNFASISIENCVNFDKTDNNQDNLISIAWKELTLVIPKSLNSDQKVILNHINGFFEFGTINAIIGSSGAGKTSLLKCFNGLYSDYLTKNTKIMLSKFHKIKTCFITQDQKDHILRGLTAKQAMIYASRLKNCALDFDHKQNVDNIMNEMLFNNTNDTNVELCSGGEQKRLVIAMELTARRKPNLLCIDEPTSGLDSNAAEVVIKILMKLSKEHNICVITSIHQPNNDILMKFDKMYVLSKGGHCVYSGRPQHLPQYLNIAGIECTKTHVPVEVLLKHSCNEFKDSIITKMVEKTKELEVELISSRTSNETIVFPNGVSQINKRFFIRDFWLLVKRGIIFNIRFYWIIHLIQLFLYLTFGLIVRVVYTSEMGRPSGCISFDDDFSNTCAKTKDKLHEEELLLKNLKYNFYIVLCVTFFTISVTLTSFTIDMKLFFNEHRNGWYSTGSYYWSKSLVDLLPNLLIVVFFSYIVDIYETEDSMLFQYMVLLTIGALHVQSLGHLVGVMTGGNLMLSVYIFIAMTVLSLIFSNILIPIKELHYSLQIISYFAPVKLLMECIMLLFYGLGRCKDRELSYILMFLDVDDRQFYINLYLLILQFFLYRGIALLFLMWRTKPTINSKIDQERKTNIASFYREFYTRISVF